MPRADSFQKVKQTAEDNGWTVGTDEEEWGTAVIIATKGKRRKVMAWFVSSYRTGAWLFDYAQDEHSSLDRLASVLDVLSHDCIEAKCN